MKTGRARLLRARTTDAERLLCSWLRSKQLEGHKFVRQLPVGPYFACREQKLVVEVDGSQHADSEHDAARNDQIRALGYSVLRFWNRDVMSDCDAVVEAILAALNGELGEDLSSDQRFATPTPDHLREGQLDD